MLSSGVQDGHRHRQKPDFVPELAKDYRRKGWRPFPFRIAAKSALSAAICAAIASLSALQRISKAHDGICTDVPATSLSLSLTPTFILVALGYACSGVYGAMHSLIPYRSLAEVSQRYPLFFDIKDRPFLWSPSKSERSRISVSLVASSFLVLLVPVVKLVAAGLFEVIPSDVEQPVNIELVKSIVFNLEDTYGVADSTTVVRNAGEFTEWTSVPDFHVPKHRAS